MRFPLYLVSTVKRVEWIKKDLNLKMYLHWRWFF